MAFARLWLNEAPSRLTPRVSPGVLLGSCHSVGGNTLAAVDGLTGNRVARLWLGLAVRGFSSHTGI